MTLEAGTRVGKYEIKRLLGATATQATQPGLPGGTAAQGTRRVWPFVALGIFAFVALLAGLAFVTYKFALRQQTGAPDARAGTLDVNDLYRVPLLGGATHRLNHDLHSAVTFAPDGRQLAVSRGDTFYDEMFIQDFR